MVAAATYSSEVEQSLNEFRATRARTLAMVKALTQTELDFMPAPNRWSIGEVLDHMLLAEQLNREQVAKLIQLKMEGKRSELILTFSELNISIVGIPRFLLPLIEAPLILMNMFVPDTLRNYLTRTRLIPFRNPDPATPRHGRSAAELRGGLVASLEETERLFQSNPQLNYQEMIVQHPLLGRYDVPGLLRFMSAHEERHQSQIVSIQTAPHSPKSTRCCGARDA
jgi:DinB family protein